MARSIGDVRALCFLNSLEERVLAGPESPILLLSKREPCRDCGFGGAG